VRDVCDYCDVFRELSKHHTAYCSGVVGLSVSACPGNYLKNEAMYKYSQEIV